MGFVEKPNIVYLSKRNLLSLLSKVDREGSSRTIIKNDTVHKDYPCTRRTVVIAVPDEAYYDRPPGEVVPQDDPVNIKNAFFAGCDYGSKYAGDQFLGTPIRQRGFDEWSKPKSNPLVTVKCTKSDEGLTVGKCYELVAQDMIVDDNGRCRRTDATMHRKRILCEGTGEFVKHS